MVVGGEKEKERKEERVSFFFPLSKGFFFCAFLSFKNKRSTPRTHLKRISGERYHLVETYCVSGGSPERGQEGGGTGEEE